MAGGIEWDRPGRSTWARAKGGTAWWLARQGWAVTPVEFSEVALSPPSCPPLLWPRPRAPRPVHGRPVGRSWATNPSQLIVIAPPWTLRTQSRPNEQRRSHRQKEFRLSSGLPTIYRHRSGKIRWALRDLRRCLYGFRSPGTAPRAVAESLGGALLPPGATRWQMSRKTESVLWLDQRWHTMAGDAFSEPPGAGPGAGRIGARRVSAISRSFEGPQSGSLRPIV